MGSQGTDEFAVALVSDVSKADSTSFVQRSQHSLRCQCALLSRSTAVGRLQRVCGCAYIGFRCKQRSGNQLRTALQARAALSACAAGQGDGCSVLTASVRCVFAVWVSAYIGFRCKRCGVGYALASASSFWLSKLLRRFA